MAGCSMFGSEPTENTPVTGDTQQPEDRSTNAARGTIADQVTVKMTKTDQGQFRFTPPVVQTKPGAKVTWECEVPASVTAYHAANGKPHRVPNGTEPFDSGQLARGESFSRTFDKAGVRCEADFGGAWAGKEWEFS